MNHYTRPCAQCDRPFTTTSERSRKRFCSAACRALAWRGRNGAPHVRRAALERPAAVVGHNHTPQDLAAVLEPPALDPGALVVLEAAWRLSIAGTAEAAEAVLLELSEGQLHEALHAAVGLLSTALYDGALPELVEAAGLLTDAEEVKP
ncbi:MAG TPA: hypothetical protein PKE40_12530 [Arachnia sp.]|nr:hypothetical protein [Arachnia sp.]HMT87169.1 hypothetical protein [Arachnia sp.]